MLHAQGQDISLRLWRGNVVALSVALSSQLALLAHKHAREPEPYSDGRTLIQMSWSPLRKTNPKISQINKPLNIVSLRWFSFIVINSLSATSNMNCQLLHQKFRQKCSVVKTKTGVSRKIVCFGILIQILSSRQQKHQCLCFHY